MSRWFFYGTLRAEAVRRAVLGRETHGSDARLQGWRVVTGKGYGFPILVPDHHAWSEGILVDDLTDDDVARLAFYEEAFGYTCHDLTVEGAKAKVYLPTPGVYEPGRAWDFKDWSADAERLTVESAREYMAAFPQIDAESASVHYNMIVQRASSRIRAQDAGLADTVRTGAGAVNVEATTLPYLGYFAVRESRMTYQRFDGSQSLPIHRSGFLMGDAVTVLPYDPVRDRILVIEQFRYGPWLRDDRNPWTLEPIAGRIDAGETPEEAARREAVEEAHLTLGRLILVGQYYPSPGAISEYLYSYVAICDLPDDCAVFGGLAEEVEDIKSHLLGFEQLMALVATPEASNGPLILTAHALAGLRSALAP